MSSLLLAATAALLTGTVPPQDPKLDEGTITNPARGGIVTILQGEYLPLKTSQIKAAAQVVALGKGKYSVVILPGGLPGKGWDGETRIETAAVLDKMTLHFKGSRSQKWTGRIVGGSLTGKDPKGGIITMNKTTRISPTDRARPPVNAVVLFNGTSTGEWSENASVGEGNALLIEQGKRARDIVTEKTFGDFTLHMEFRLPLIPLARKTKRAEGGVYLQGRYEIQILDSFGAPADKTSCGAVTNLRAPDLNASLPPLTWQTFDIDFQAARWDAEGKKKTENARVTVKLNGQVIHDGLELKAKSRGGDAERNTPGPIRIQDSGFPILYRNIWVLEKK